MPANTGDNVILDLGMRVDSTGAQADIQDVVDYIRDTIKEDFNIDIRAGNLNELRQQLNALGGDLRLVKDDATGMTTAIQASFKTANGEAVKLRAAIEEVNGQYQLAGNTDMSARVTAGASALQKLNEQLIQQKERLAQAAVDANATEINSASAQIKKIESKIEQEQRYLGILRSVSDVAQTAQERTDRSDTLVAAKSDYVKFAESISEAKTQLKEFEKIQSQAFAATNMDKSSATYQNLQANLSESTNQVKNFLSIFNEAAKLIDKNITDDVATIKSLSDGSVELTSTYNGQNKALKEMSDLINKVGKNLKTAFAQQSDKMTDTQKIQAAVKAYQQYRDAVLTVDKAKASGRTATQQETTAVNQAKAAYQQCEQAILSNGEAVQQNAAYNRDKNQITRNSIQALKEYESQLGSVNNSMAGSIAQMIQMKLSFEGLQEAIRKVYDTAKELNDSMTDIQLVTQQSDSDATELMKSYSGLAQEMGTTTAEVAASADEWLNCLGHYKFF